MKILFVMIYLILTTLGVIFMKLGGNTGEISLQEGEILFAINWISAMGFVCYLCSFLMFTKIVTMFKLSYIFPICTGIVQILTLIASGLIFNEIINAQAIIGVAFIIVGVIVMNMKKEKEILTN